MIDLHVFNGDCAAAAWARGPLARAGRAVVLRENYLEGALPPPETSPAAFAAARAAELKRLMPGLDGMPGERVAAGLAECEQALREAPRGARAWLWFDACCYDQLLLARVAFVMRDSLAEVRLACDAVSWGDAPWRFAARQPTMRRLSRDALAFLAAGWAAVAGGPAALRAFLAAPGAAPAVRGELPHFLPGLARYAADHPLDGGLGRSREQLLQIVAAGRHAFADIFRGFDAYEEHPFLSDVMCRHLLADLVAAGRLRAENGGWRLA